MCNHVISNKLPRSTPEEQGITSKAILQFLEEIKNHNLELHSLMILRHGHVVAEGWWYPYSCGKEHMLFSLTKSFTSIAVGFAISEGRIALTDTLASFFPEMDSKQTYNGREVTIKDLLTMSVGHEEPTMGWDLQQLEGSWVKYFLDKPLEHMPGTRFLYNTSASQMLSAIIQKATGLQLIDYLEPRLFAPLNIARPFWQTSPEGHNTGGHGLSLKTEDLAKFSLFLLQQGCWEGKQLLPKDWIKKATALQISNGDDIQDDWQQGYGFHFWRCRHDSYRADGAYGQFCVILPNQDAAIIITSATHDGALVLNLIWDYLLPGMYEHSLPSDDEARLQLAHQTQQFTLPTPRWKNSSSVPEKISNKVFKMNTNEYGIEEITLVFNQAACTFIVKDSYQEHRINCGLDKWVEGKTTFFHNQFHAVYQPEIVPVYGTAGWNSECDFEMRWCFVTTPFTDIVHCRFAGNTINIRRTINTDQNEKRSILIGHLDRTEQGN